MTGILVNEDKTDVLRGDEFGKTALHYACQNGDHIKIMVRRCGYVAPGDNVFFSLRMLPQWAQVRGDFDREKVHGESRYGQVLVSKRGQAGQHAVHVRLPQLPCQHGSKIFGRSERPVLLVNAIC